MNSTYCDTMGIREALKHTWMPFFGRFGKLLPVQEMAIPKVLTGSNLVIVSPAATGKTEAVVAPVVERMKQERWPAFSILYVVPTRALVNDLYKRLQPPLDRLGVSLLRRTSEHPDFKPTRVSNFLLTTPESLDSLVARYPKLFETLRVMIIDELHLYDGTYRGDQLRVLIQRINHIVKQKPNFYAMSATIYEPNEMGHRYMDEFDTIVVHTEREIDHKVIPYDGDVRGLLDELNHMGVRKVLIFSNTRRDAEDIAMRIKASWSYGRNVWVHHGSLDKRVREAVERMMDSVRVGMISATTTLELGIDIGDIDCVVFNGVPPSVTAMLQRIGRGNRRTNRLVAIGLYRDEMERLFFEVMFDKIRRGWIEPYEYRPKLSVAVQQLLSYVYQKRASGVTIDKLLEVLTPLEISRDELRELVVNLISRGYLKMELFSIIYPGDRMGGLVARGRIHSNIETIPSKYEVYDVRTGERIGEMEFIVPTFFMRGRMWTVERESSGRVFVREVSGRPHDAGKVYKGKGYVIWDASLGNEVKKRMFGVDDKQFVKLGNRIYHFVGVIYGSIWAEVLRRRGIKAVDHGGIYLTVDETKDITTLTRDEVKQVINHTWVGIKNLLGLGTYFSWLPEGLKRKAIYQAINVDRFMRLIQDAEIVTPTIQPNTRIYLT